MSDREKKFHQFALQSILFKGRGDWYFCFLKAERIAHVLAVLGEKSPSSLGALTELSHAAALLPHTIAHCAAGEVNAPVVLADIFSLLTTVRLAGTSGTVGEENARVLVGEYERLAERFAGSLHPSPFVSSEDFALPAFDAPAVLAPLHQERLSEGIPVLEPAPAAKGRKDRVTTILDFVRKNKRVSIKDISAVIRGCSEKTIQRELSRLIRQGFLKRVGERRWSVYIPIPTPS